MMEFLAGFVIGVSLTFIVSALFLWKPMVMELRAELKAERERRIRAEDNAAHNAPEFEWGPPPVPIPRTKRWELDVTGDGSIEVVDLTNVGDVPNE